MQHIGVDPLHALPLAAQHSLLLIPFWHALQLDLQSSICPDIQQVGWLLVASQVSKPSEGLPFCKTQSSDGLKMEGADGCAEVLGWIDGCVEMLGWIDGFVESVIDGCEEMLGLLDGWEEGWLDGWEETLG